VLLRSKSSSRGPAHIACGLVDEFLTVNEVAQTVKLNPQTVRNLVIAQFGETDLSTPMLPIGIIRTYH
jgi:hypothetical protein